MALNYNPKDAATCWDEGAYDASLVKVESGVSKSSGKDMEILHFRCYHPNGNEQTIKDYIVVPSTLFKLKRLAIAIGQKAEFENGTFQAENYINSNVKVFLKVDRQDGFDDKNVIDKFVTEVSTNTPVATQQPRTTVSDFRPAKQPVTPSPISEEAVFKDDDIPF